MPAGNKVHQASYHTSGEGTDHLVDVTLHPVKHAGATTSPYMYTTTLTTCIHDETKCRSLECTHGIDRCMQLDQRPVGMVIASTKMPCMVALLYDQRICHISSTSMLCIRRHSGIRIATTAPARAVRSTT